MHSTVYHSEFDEDLSYAMADDSAEWDDPTFDAALALTDPLVAACVAAGMDPDDPRIAALTSSAASAALTQEHIMTSTTQYDSGLPDSETATVAEQIDAVGIEKVASSVVALEGASVRDDASPWDAVDALLGVFTEHPPADFTQSDHNELIARGSRKYFGQRNPAYVTMIPVGPSTRANWDEDSIVNVYSPADRDEVIALLTRPTGEFREYVRADGSEGEIAERVVSRIARFGDADESDEWIRNLRLALRNAQIDHLADDGFGERPGPDTKMDRF